jgi:CO/xanthine dehydrogenase Mo-binding subunit
MSQLAISRDVVRYVGEIVAMVVADSRAVAEDACELIEVDYEPLPPVTDMVAGAEPGSPVLHPECGSNVASPSPRHRGLRREAFAAPTSARPSASSYVGMPLEGRGVVALGPPRPLAHDRNSTQVPAPSSGARHALELAPHKIA